MKKKLLALMLVFGFAFTPLASADIIGSGSPEPLQSEDTDTNAFLQMLKDIIGSGAPSAEEPPAEGDNGGG